MTSFAAPAPARNSIILILPGVVEFCSTGVQRHVEVDQFPGSPVQPVVPSKLLVECEYQEIDHVAGQDDQ